MPAKTMVLGNVAVDEGEISDDDPNDEPLAFVDTKQAEKNKIRHALQLIKVNKLADGVRSVSANKKENKNNVSRFSLVQFIAIRAYLQSRLDDIAKIQARAPPLPAVHVGLPPQRAAPRGSEGY